MRFLHTADLHAGRSLHGVDRTPDIAAALSEIVSIACEEKVDAVLVAGDLFDSPNPRPGAESVVYGFFEELHQKGIGAVASVGNHDSAARLGSVAGMLRWGGVYVVSQVLSPQGEWSGPICTLKGKDGSAAQVAAIPYLGERRLVRLAHLQADPEDGESTAGARAKLHYREALSQIIGRVCAHFEAGFSHLLMLHGTMDGAKPSGSERNFEFDLSNAYTLSEASLPPSAQYVALGHIHKPQQVSHTPPAYYAGSVVQLDFGEAGEQKSVRIVDVLPSQPVKSREVPLSPQKPLFTLRCSLEQLESRLLALREHAGYIKVVVSGAEGSAPGLRDQVRAAHSGVLTVALERPKEASLSSLTSTQTSGGTGTLPLPKLFGEYYAQQHGEASKGLMGAFEESWRATAPDSEHLSEETETA